MSEAKKSRATMVQRRTFETLDTALAGESPPAVLLGMRDYLAPRRLEFSDNKAIRERTHDKDDGRHREPREVGPKTAEGESHHQLGEEACKISSEVFDAGPHAHFAWRRAALEDDVKIAGGKTDERGSENQDDGRTGALNPRRGNEQKTGEKCEGKNAFSSARLVPPLSYQPVRKPAAHGFADREYEESERGKKTGFGQRQVMGVDQEIRQPEQHHVPVVIKTKKAEANPEQVFVEHNRPETAQGDGAARRRPLLRTTIWHPRRESQQPGDKPHERAESHEQEHFPPAVVNDQPGDQDAVKHEPGPRSGVEESGRETAFFWREEQADDFDAAREVDGLSEPEKNSQRDQSPQAARKAREPARKGPDRKHHRIEPTKVEAVGAPADRHLHQGVRPEERRSEHSLGPRPQAEVVCKHRQRHRKRGPVHVVDHRGRKQQANDRPPAGAREFRCAKLELIGVAGSGGCVFH